MATTLNEQIFKASQGDKNACAELYKSTYRKTFFLADKILQNEREAHKVIEKSYAEAFSGLKNLGNPDLFESWIVNITAKNCCNYIKENMPSAFRGTDYSYISAIKDNMEFLPAELPGSEKAVAFVSRLIDSLPVYQRAAVMLCYNNNLPASGIAHMLSLSEENVKSMLYSAREKIKTETDARLPKATKLYLSDKAPVLEEVFSATQMQKQINPDLFRESFMNIINSQTQPEKKAPAVSAAPVRAEKTSKKKSPAIKIIAIIVAVAVALAGIVGGGIGISALFNKDKNSGEAPHLEAAPSGFVPLYTSEDLELIRSDLSAKYIMMNDIDMSSVSNWEPIASEAEALDEGFNGVFDGNGYTIKNLTSKSHSQAGLFAYVCDGTVMNVNMENVDINGTSCAGGVAANVFGIKSNSKANVSNCHIVSGKITSAETAGGIAGNLMAFENEESNPVCISKYCSNGAAVSGEYAGGIAGYASVGSYGTVIANNNLNYGEISGNFYSGGLFGEIENDEGKVTISDSVSVGKVVAHTSDNSNASTGLIAATIDADNDFSVELVNCIYTIVDGLDPYKLGAAVIKDETIGVSEKDAKKKSTYEILDFETIWEWDSKKKIPVLKKFLASDNSELISGTPDESATESTTALSKENLTASSSDFDSLLEIVDNIVMLKDSYNYVSSDAYDTMTDVILGNPFSHAIYSVYFDNFTYISGDKDPLNKFGDNYYEYYIFPGEEIDWIISNVFNLTPDHSVTTSDFYYHNGSYYLGIHGYGDYVRKINIQSKSQNPDGSYTVSIKCEVFDSFDTSGTGDITYYTAKAAFRDDNGQKYWSLYSITPEKSIAHETEKAPSDGWKEAYNEFLHSYYDEVGEESPYSLENTTFGFAYINDDDIPELLISEGTYMSATVKVVTFINNDAYEIGDFGFMGELPYVEKGSLFIDGYYNRGIETYTFYKFSDNGSLDKVFSSYTNEGAVGESNAIYKINDVEVSLEEYLAECEANDIQNTKSFVNSDGYALTPGNIDKYC